MTTKPLISLTTTKDKTPNQVCEEVKENIAKYDFAKVAPEPQNQNGIVQVMFFRKGPNYLGGGEK